MSNENRNIENSENMPVINRKISALGPLFVDQRAGKYVYTQIFFQHAIPRPQDGDRNYAVLEFDNGKFYDSRKFILEFYMDGEVFGASALVQGDYVRVIPEDYIIPEMVEKFLKNAGNMTAKEIEIVMTLYKKIYEEGRNGKHFPSRVPGL